MKEELNTSSCLALSQPAAGCAGREAGEQLMSSPQPPFPGSRISIIITAPEAARRIQSFKKKIREFKREINSVANHNAQRVGWVSVLKDSCTCSLGTVVLSSRPSPASGHHFSIRNPVSWGKSPQGTIPAAIYPKTRYVLFVTFSLKPCSVLAIKCRAI